MDQSSINSGATRQVAAPLSQLLHRLAVAPGGQQNRNDKAMASIYASAIDSGTLHVERVANTQGMHS